MSKKDINFIWHERQKDTFDPLPSDEPVTVYAVPESTQPGQVYFFEKAGPEGGLEMTKNAKNYTLVLRPPATEREVVTRWAGELKEVTISIKGGTVFYDGVLNKNLHFGIASFSSMVIEDGGRLKIGTSGRGDIEYVDHGSRLPGVDCVTLNGDSSFELELNGGKADYLQHSCYRLNGASRMTIAGREVNFREATSISLTNSAKLKVVTTEAGEASGFALIEDASLSLRDQAMVEIYSDRPYFDYRGRFTLNDASATLSFFPPTEGAEPFEFGKGRYPKGMFNFTKVPGPTNQSRLFIPGKLSAAFLVSAMLKDQVLAINGTVIQDAGLIEQTTETINTSYGPRYGTWIFLSKKP